MEFDIFKLHSNNDHPKVWIWAELQSEYLKVKYNTFLKDTTQKELAVKIAKDLHCGQSTIEKHLSRIKYSNVKINMPLPVLERLCAYLGLSNRTINDSIQLLYCNTDRTRKRVKAVRSGSPPLAKLIGAHMADGYLQRISNSYKIKICDGEETSIRAASMWIEEVFGISSRIRYYQLDHLWHCWFNNKIIGRYFAQIFMIPAGKKSDVAHRPKFIRGRENERAFALGVLTFDGGIKTTGMVGISSKSELLIRQIAATLKRDGILLRIYHNKRENFYSIEASTGRDVKQLKKWLDYFEPGTRKYQVLEFFVGGKMENVEDLVYLFPKHYRSNLSVVDIQEAISEEVSASELLVNLKLANISVKKTTLYKYLHILSKAGVITKRTINKEAFYSKRKQII